eukprot:4218141-Prymnesium_polylepis.2
MRALTITGGRVILARTVLFGHSAGAIGVVEATLILIETTIRDCRARTGGAVLVGRDSTVRGTKTLFTDNSADVSGGALQVDGGRVELFNETLFRDNSASDGSGPSIHLSQTGTIEYTLPAPPGRWLFVRTGDTFQLDPGGQDDFPFACPSGVVGSSSAQEQKGPQCSGPCPEGRFCPTATIHPQPCARGFFCPSGTPVAISCPPGSFSNSDSLGSAMGCKVCPRGFWCSLGTSVPAPCASGRYGAAPRQTSRECTGPCLRGHYCEEGSKSNTSGVCRECNRFPNLFTHTPNEIADAWLPFVAAAGRFNRDIGGTSLAACLASPKGTAAPIEGLHEPADCEPGYHQNAPGQLQCVPCAAGEFQPESGRDGCLPCREGEDSVQGSARCTHCSEHYFRPSAESPLSQCTACDTIEGIRCQTNATTSTFSLKDGYWRHSTATSKIYRCKAFGDWSPCRGGPHASDHGDLISAHGSGYCDNASDGGYWGPRCEVRGSLRLLLSSPICAHTTAD